ncbi:hypothetical protein G6M24_26890 [Agrobacterium tumefaciens]|nr:hypothetical protein [Agrobacterium tumefaciens]
MLKKPPCNEDRVSLVRYLFALDRPCENIFRSFIGNIRGNLLLGFVCGNEIASMLKELPRIENRVSLVR